MDNLSHHTINPYSYKLIIATIENDKQATDLVEKFSMDDPSVKRLGGVYKVIHEGWSTFLIFLNFNANETLTYGMVAHEALHVVDELFNSIGHAYDVENNEVGAYLIEWIVNQIFKHLEDRDLLKKLSYESDVKDINKIISKIISKKERKSL
jgi:hypothetical protein